MTVMPPLVVHADDTQAFSREATAMVEWASRSCYRYVVFLPLSREVRIPRLTMAANAPMTQRYKKE